MKNVSEIARIDLHCHSWASDRPSLWLMQRLGCPESFTSPETVRETAMQRGMNFVTITDHNTDAGVRTIEHYGNVIPGDEVTAYFPGEVKVHVVCLGFTEQQHERIHQIRHDIHLLARYLHEQKIVHFCAHPLHKINGRLTWDHFEKILLLFKTLEILNGTRLRRFNWITEQIVAHLTKEDIERLAAKHGIEPVGEEPWKKIVVGGSDDHSGLFIGTCYTEIQVAELSVEGVLEGIRLGRTRVCGNSDGCLTLSHQVNSIAYQFFRNRLGRESEELLFILGRIFERNRPLKLNSKMRFRRRLKRFFNYFRRPKGFNLNLIEEIREIISSNVALKSLFTEGVMTREEYNQNVFTLASDVLDQMIVRVFERPQLLHYFIVFAPTVLSAYLMTIRNLHGERDLILSGEQWLGIERKPKVAWFTDSFGGADCVSKTCLQYLHAARARKQDLYIVTSTTDSETSENVIKYRPIKSFQLPGYEKNTLHVPSILKMIKFIEDQDFDAIVVSTPGPVGVIGLLCAKLMRIPVHGVYHTDFPRMALRISGDPMFAEMALLLTRMFYRQVDQVFSLSQRYFEDFKNYSIPPNRIHLLPRWIDTVLFTPSRRNENYWKEHGLIKILYVGRIAKDKNIERLIRLYEHLSNQSDSFVFYCVGDGPDIEEFKKKTSHLSRFLFTGRKEGNDLAIAYASADIFVYPNPIDSYKTEILEAMASGLPCIAMRNTLPPVMVRHEKTGFLCHSDAEFFQSVKSLLLDDTRRKTLSFTTAKYALDTFSEEKVFAHFWNRITQTTSQSYTYSQFHVATAQEERILNVVEN